MNKVGKYNGVKWMQKRLCDVFNHMETKGKWYFVLDYNGGYTGDHFKTLKELEKWVDNLCPTEKANICLSDKPN